MQSTWSSKSAHSSLPQTVHVPLQVQSIALVMHSAAFSTQPGICMPVLDELMAVVLAADELVLPVVVELVEPVVEVVAVEAPVVVEVVVAPPAPPLPSSSPQAARATKKRPKAKVEGVLIRRSLARDASPRTKWDPPSD
jgi:hypothetical protein